MSDDDGFCTGTTTNWCKTLPIVLILGGVVGYRCSFQHAEVARVRPFIEQLGDEDERVVSVALLEIGKAEKAALPFVDQIVPLLGDPRIVPPAVRGTADYGRVIHGLRGFERPATVGDLAGSALAAISMPSDIDADIDLRRKVSAALRPVLRDGTTEQKLDAISVLSLVRVIENVEVMGALMGDEDPKVRAYACVLAIPYSAIFDLRSYLPLLRNMRDRDEDETARSMAGMVLRTIESRR